MLGFVWTDGFMVGMSAGKLCLVDSTGVATAEHLGVLATTLESRCAVEPFLN